MLIRADYHVDTLEDKINLGYKEVITGINEIKNSIKGLKTQLDQIGNNTGISKLNKQIKQTSGFSKTLKGIAGLGTAVVTGRKMFKVLKGMTEESVNFVETQNLFNVSMGKGLTGLNQYYEQAVKFQNELEEKLGVNIEESMNYQALFNSMSKSMGISAKYAYTLSENFTKLGYDLASLYNIDSENAMEKLRAGLAGQTKPLRDLGLDITQQSLQPIADELGIETSIKNMSQAEKMILRYIAVLKQAQIAQGDFANTMETPANQLRIFNAQITAFKRNMGNLWQGFLGGILPYINGIMMVVNELLKLTAKLFGFKVSDQTTSISASIGVDDLSDDLGTATGNAKELKNQLMGFDEINNISLQNDTSSGSSSTSVGGIDQRLLDAMSEYDNLMDSVSGKATKIRDKIMEWLGFTKEINPLTGEISWEYTGMSKQAKIILGILKGIVGLYVGTKILKFIGYLKTLKGVLKGVITPTTSFQNGLASLGKGAKTTWTAFKLGVEQFKLYRKEGDNVITALGKTNSAMLSLIPNTIKVTAGIAGLAVSTYSAFESMKKFGEGSAETGETIGKLSISVAGATASGALLGSVIPGVGTAVGALGGAVVGLTASLLGYTTGSQDARIETSLSSEELEKLTDKLNESKQAYENTIESINKSAESKLIDVEYSKTLSEELVNLVDSNGKVKEGCEERVDYILGEMSEALGTEISRNEDIIKINGEVINSYDELKNSIGDIVQAKQEEIEQEAILELNKEKIKRRIQLEMELTEAKEAAQKASEDLYNAEQEGINAFSMMFSKKQREICNKMIETDNKVKELSAEYESICSEISTTTELMANDIVKDYKKIENETEQSIEGQIDVINEKSPEVAKVAEELSNTIIDKLDNSSEAREKAVEAVKSYISGLSDEDQREILKQCGIDNAEEVMKGLKKGNLAEDVGINIIKGLHTGLQNNYWQGRTLSTAFTFASNVLSKFKKTFGISSPSRKTKKFGVYLLEGLGLGVKKESRNVLNTISDFSNQLLNEFDNPIKEFSDGIEVDTKEFAINASEYVDYGAISGNISTKINNNNLGEIIAGAIINGMQKAEIQVDIKAETEEGVIVKKASKGFKEFVEQTGELPFPVPV